MDLREYLEGLEGISRRIGGNKTSLLVGIK